MITPIVKVSKGKQVKSFYNLSDYHEWTESTSDYKKWHSKYYKGLGTSTSVEAREYFKNMKMNNYLWTDDTDDKMNNSLLQKTGDVLIVSQFTLFANIQKGNRPSWNKAAPPKEAKLLYNNFIREFKLLYNSNKIICDH